MVQFVKLFEKLPLRHRRVNDVTAGETSIQLTFNRDMRAIGMTKDEENCVCGSNPTTKWERLEEEEFNVVFCILSLSQGKIHKMIV